MIVHGIMYMVVFVMHKHAYALLLLILRSMINISVYLNDMPVLSGSIL